MLPAAAAATEGCQIPDGTLARCARTGEISLLEGGQRRWYSPEAFIAAGSPAPTWEEGGDCPLMAACPAGPDMPIEEAGGAPAAG